MRNVKRALSLVIVLALALSMCAIGAGAVVYSDVNSNYAYSAEVQFLSDLEIITGYPDGTFQPEGTITRAEAAAVIFRTLAGKESSSENYKGKTDFSDVGADHWACGYINFCVEMGIITGYPDGTFLPEKEITYAEYVVMLARALGLDIGKDLSFPYGYIAEATVENVNYGVDLAAGEPCSRGAVSKLTYNAILDATYRRIANNIYVTEKPTIAKNVLKLSEVEGVVTSIGDYDWVGSNPVGEDYFRINWADGDTGGSGEAEDVYSFEYELDKSFLGKEVTIWYKDDAVTASGDRVYAVIEGKNSSATLPHIVLKGCQADDDANEITYALNDVDYTAKLDDECIFIENNEYYGDMTGDIGGTLVTAETFYPGTDRVDADDKAVGIRAWLPISYTFIDNDADGRYEFVTRSIYGFAEVTGISSSRINLDTIGSIDLTDDNGNAYDWVAGLEDVAEEDWVVYYADGKVTTPGAFCYMPHPVYGDSVNLASLRFAEIAVPSFDTDLYEETNNASVVKMDFATLAVEDIIDHDRYVFDGTTYRTWTGGHILLGADSYVDLAEGDDIMAEIGDEYELWYTNSFGGIIAAAEAVDAATGDFLVVLEVDGEAFSGDFDIKAVLADGEDDVYTVKTDDEENYQAYKDSEEDGVEIGLTQAVIDGNGINGLYEYKTNSKGQITGLDYYNIDPVVIDVDQDYEDYFKTKSGKLYGDTADFVLADNAVVFVSEYVGGEWDDTTVYIGSFPKIKADDTTTVTVVGAKTKEISGTVETKALHVVIEGAAALSSGSEDEDIAGYLRAVKRTGNADDGYYYEYTIAYGDQEDAVLRSRVAEDTDALEDVVSDDNLIGNDEWIKDMGKAASIILFDIAPDGTICEMDAVDELDGIFFDAEGVERGSFVRENDEKMFFAGYFATATSNSKSRITVVSADENTVLATARANGDVIVNADEEIYSLADDCTIFVFDMDSTNFAKVEIGSIGDIEKINDGEGSLFSFAYDDEEGEITTIFVNGDPIEGIA